MHPAGIVLSTYDVNNGFNLYFSSVMFYIKYHRNIKYNYHVHKYCVIRGGDDLHVSGCTTNLYQNSVLNLGIKLHNMLPEKIKRLHTLNSSKKI